MIYITTPLDGLDSSSIQYVLSNEGGYDVDDGGITNCGITIPFYSQYLKRQATAADVVAITPDIAMNVYNTLIWAPFHLTSLTDQNVACCILDTAVNRGNSIGSLYAQMTCNLLLSGQLTLDGVMGEMTAVNVAKCNRADFISHYQSLEVAGYTAILAKHPEDEMYRDSWMARANRLLTLIK